MLLILLRSAHLEPCRTDMCDANLRWSMDPNRLFNKRHPRTLPCLLVAHPFSNPSLAWGEAEALSRRLAVDRHTNPSIYLSTPEERDHPADVAFIDKLPSLSQGLRNPQTLSFLPLDKPKEEIERAELQTHTPHHLLLLLLLLIPILILILITA